MAQRVIVKAATPSGSSNPDVAEGMRVTRSSKTWKDKLHNLPKSLQPTLKSHKIKQFLTLNFI